MLILVLIVFVLIAWLSVIILFIIPKHLKLTENVTAFFLFTILILNNFAIIDLNLNLLPHSNIPEMFVCVLIQRNIITPLSLVIFVNLIFYVKSILKKITIIVVILTELTLVEFLTVWTGIKTYNGWNCFLTIVLFAGEMTVCCILAKIIKKFP